MPTIGEALAEGERALLVGRAGELRLFERWLDDDPRPPEVLEISGPGGIGKSSLLAAFGRLAQSRGRAVVDVDLRGAAGNPAGLLELFGGADAHAVAKRLNHTRPLVLLDTFEEAGDLQRVLAEELLPRLDTAVKVVIAGRGRLGHSWRAERPDSVAIRSVALAGLAPEDGRTYLRRRGLVDDALIEQILQLVGGHPLALTLAADLVLHTGMRNFGASPERHLLIRSLAEQLLRSVSDPHLRELIEASAVVEQFDQSTLEAIVQQPGGDAAFEQLCRLSVVRPVPHGLMLHDDVRRILADDLRWRYGERYTNWRLRAMEHFRERMRAASAEDRAWLLTQRLYLCEHAFVQTMLFGSDDPGEVWVEHGTAQDERDALEIEMIWHTQVLPSLGWVNYALDPGHDTQAHAADMQRLLALPGRRLTMARDQSGQALGFTLLVPLCLQTADCMAANRFIGPPLRAYLPQLLPGGLPPSPRASRIWYFVQAAHRGVQAEAVSAALWRDVFDVFVQAGSVLLTVALEVQKELVRALGFERLPGEFPTFWGMAEPTEAYQLDLDGIGLEPWIEAIMAGRRPPRVLSAEQLEHAVQAALLHWREDAWLGQSELARSTVVSRLAPERTGADAVRASLGLALARARAQASAEQALAYRALESAYFTRTGSHERAAEELAVSRTTFYRLLRRGSRGLAEALRQS